MPLPNDEPFTDTNNPELDNPPRVGNESAADNFAANHESTHKMLHDEMKGRVHVDQKSVWTQLKIDDLNANLVRTCSQQLQIACRGDIAGLKNLAGRAKSGSGTEEKKMYPFLVSFFRSIFVNQPLNL